MEEAVPSQNDVLFGKGVAINSHHGNKHLRSIVELQKPKFLQTRREDKRAIAKAIVQEIQETGGRFLMEDPNKNDGRGNKRGRQDNHQQPCQPAKKQSDDRVASATTGLGLGIVSVPSILDKVWVQVEKEKAIDKVMHRLREKTKKDKAIDKVVHNRLLREKEENTRPGSVVASAGQKQHPSSSVETERVKMGMQDQDQQPLQDVKLGSKTFCGTVTSSANGGCLHDNEKVAHNMTMAMNMNATKEYEAKKNAQAPIVASGIQIQSTLLAPTLATTQNNTIPTMARTAMASGGFLHQAPPPAQQVVSNSIQSSTLGGLASCLFELPPNNTNTNAPSQSRMMKSGIGGIPYAKAGLSQQHYDKEELQLQLQLLQQATSKNNTIMGYDATKQAGTSAGVVLPYAKAGSSQHHYSDEKELLLQATLQNAMQIKNGTTEQGQGGGTSLLSQALAVTGIQAAAPSSALLATNNPKIGVGFSHHHHHHHHAPTQEVVSAQATTLQRLPVLAPQNAPVPIGIKYWIKSTLALLGSHNSTPTHDDYLKSAVDLSWLLTKHLMKLTAAMEITLQDIRLDKVVLFVEPPPSTEHKSGSSRGGAASSNSLLVIRDIQIQRGSLNNPLLLTPAQRHVPGVPLRSRAVCCALGNILLEIFSMGRSSAPGVLYPGIMPTITPSSNSNSYSSCAGQMSGHNDPMMMPPLQRRKISSVPMTMMYNNNGSTSVSSVANGLLLQAGMPMPVRVLVCDLLDAIITDESSSSCRTDSTALTSLEEVLWDLSQMRDDPQHFLLDRTCPQKALEDMGLFFRMEDKRLFGREKELGILMDAKENIANHVRNTNGNEDEEKTSIGSCSQQHSSFGQEIDFRCETIFLSGYAGSGKSKLLHSLMHACTDDNWFILSCKFTKQEVPVVKVLANAFNDFFGKWALKNNEHDAPLSHLDTVMIESFRQVCRSARSTLGLSQLGQLCEMIPNMSKVFPEVATTAGTTGHIHDQETSSINQVGYGKERLSNLFHVLYKSLCSSGRPVLLVYDDLQWADSMECMKDLVMNYINIPFAVQKGTCTSNHGLLIVGAFRSNEVEANDGIIKTIAAIQQSKSAKVNVLAIGEMTQGDIMTLLSAKFCLPLRHTNKLAALVLSKTRGNPFFIVQFLKSIVQNGMLQFSQRWKWDCEVIDMLMISDGVAELLTTRFNQLPGHLMWTLKIVSCLGAQADGSTINALNLEQQVSFNMQDALKLAIEEGLVEKAGPLYQFTHDVIQQTIYDSIPAGNRKLLHRTIGESLLKSAGTNDPTIHLLAVDQINRYCKESILNQLECSQFAKANATASRFAIAASSFEQARSYIDAGIKMLDINHWDNQYSLSLDLYEMSASVSCIHGDTRTMSECLNAIIPNVRSFEDSLVSSSLLVKLLAAASKYDEAIDNCLSVLSTLGEEFPQDITSSIVMNELSIIQTTLSNITTEQVKLLPPMTNSSKLHAMKFLSMLCTPGLQSKPMLVPLLSCRMVRLTIEHGFCDDSIVGLVTAGFTLFSFTDEVQLGYQIGKVGEALLEESPNMHALRSRLCFELDSTLKAVVEPIHSAVSDCPDRYNSAMLAGDIYSAMVALLCYCIGNFHIGSDLKSVSKSFVMCIKQSTKYNQDAMLHLAMSSLGACMFLSGSDNVEVHVKSYDELNQIGARKNLLILLYNNFFNEMICYFWMRDYKKVVELTTKHKPSGQKRTLELMRIVFEGITALTLARHTHQPVWRKIGEEALEKMLKWEKISKWNFENKVRLLQAELHYLNGDLDSANDAYEASIVSAHAHKLLNYQALAYELHGIFCVETGRADRGFEQLGKALEKYKQWGAMKKVEDLQFFMDLINPDYLRRELKICI